MKHRCKRLLLCLVLVFALAVSPALAGNYASQIQSIANQFSHQNVMADNIYQQICNGTYRTTEFLNIIAYELDD